MLSGRMGAKKSPACRMIAMGGGGRHILQDTQEKWVLTGLRR